VRRPITGPALDGLTAQWLDGDIPADRYVQQARRLARESARRDIAKQDHRRINGMVPPDGAGPEPADGADRA
jgi:hypothetical protein